MKYFNYLVIEYALHFPSKLRHMLRINDLSNLLIKPYNVKDIFG